MRKKYLVLTLALVLALAVALTGCGSGSSSSNAAGKTLIFGRGADTTSLDPATVTDGESFRVTQNIFDTLVSYDYSKQSTNVIPSLATSWAITNGGKTYTFKLRKGVKFQDGTDFNAQAVVYNFDRWMNGKASGKFAYFPSMFGGYKGDAGLVIQSVTAPDANTVVFNLTRPSAPFLKNLAMSPFAISSPAAIKKYGKNYGTTAAVGTGAYVFKSWKRNDTITLAKNKNYWKKGLPKLDTIVFKVIPDNSSRLNALKNGEIDLMDGVNPSDVSGLKGNSQLQVYSRPPMNVAYLGFNVTVKPFDNPKVRQALNMAVDKQGIIKAFYNGEGQAATNPMPPSLLGYDKSIKPYSYDLTAAKKLLAEAGYPNGFSTTLYTMSNPRDYMPEPQNVAQSIQSTFGKIGVKVNIVTVEWSSYIDKLMKGGIPMYLMGWIGDNGDPDNFLYTLLDKDSIGSNNLSFYSNDQLHNVLIAAQSQTNDAQRVALYNQAQVIIHNDAPWVPLVYAKPVLVGKSTITGYKPSPTGSEPLENVSIK
ncbi:MULTISPECIES: ABC transporter substrate-binding protein [unclassified Sporolactobacillus]|uniref:ABC transporter substrate-binding protein n=1 Tax=unclassified Sporolactobacillus TaxID=2628533 RepID=UPI002368D914|nr:ABC transporter substrate-binding protein [Sporolactobacillus sp. CQH2019]MDD9150397.1 ABC transporter substrate-binding protein [Sporolactobacillus sp. CQH2019]